MDVHQSIINAGLSVCDFSVSHRILKFLEKPKAQDTQSRLASPVFYCLRRETLTLVTSYAEQHLGKKERAFGLFMVRQGGGREREGGRCVEGGELRDGV